MLAAVDLVPDEPMYQLYLGRYAYELAQARRTDRTAPLDLRLAHHALQRAIEINPQLWRADYYLGRIARDRGDAKAAAYAFTRALTSAPAEPGVWIALAELYRRWRYTDEALTVATQATTFAAGTDVWFELGMANFDAKKPMPAIAAFGKALDLDAHNVKALFQRGMTYAHVHMRREAQRDLAAVVAAAADQATDATIQLGVLAAGRWPQ
jgi:tetratricopeptide (TPR) repeat protein